MMTISEKIRCIEKAFDLPENSLKPSDRLDEIENYDGLISRVVLILMIEDKYEQELTEDQFSKFVTVQDLIDFIGYP